MKLKVTYTHKGWFGLCPVYLANLDGVAPDIHARHWSMEWLFDLSEAIFRLINWIQSSVDPLHEGGWPLYVTGELDQPKVIWHEAESFLNNKGE